MAGRGLTHPLERWAWLGRHCASGLGTGHSVAEQMHGMQAYLKMAEGRRRLHTSLSVGELGGFFCVDVLSLIPQGLVKMGDRRKKRQI